MAGYHNTKAAIRGKQKRLLEILFENSTDSIQDICDKAGITVTTYYRYVQRPEFQKAINDLTHKICATNKSKVLTALMRQAAKGNVAAIRTALELDGTLNTKGSTQSVNIYQEAKERETVSYNNDKELLTELEKRKQELDKIADTVKARMQARDYENDDTDTPARKTHAIHPESDPGTCE